MNKHNGSIVFTCCECYTPYTELTGDIDERMCDICLNHEDEFSKKIYDVSSDDMINDPDDGSWVGR